MAGPDVLVWLDMEMTGLEPERERIIEIATILTDGNLTEIALGPELVIHQPDEVLAAMDDWNRKHHGASGLVDRVKASTITEADAEAQTIAFINAHVPAKDRPVLAGNSIHQDRRFIHRYMPAFDGACTTGWSTSRRSRSSAGGGSPRSPRSCRRRRRATAPSTTSASRSTSCAGTSSTCSCSRLLDPPPRRKSPGRNAAAGARELLVPARMRTIATVLAAVTLLGCSMGPTDDGDPEDSIAVDDGKADDFFSASALEYTVTGKASVTFTSQPTQAQVEKLISEKQIAIAWFLTQYLVDKEDDDANKDFGGFGGMAKGGMWQDLDVQTTDNLTYTFTFKQLVAGGKTMLSKLPIKTVGGQQVFDLEIGKPTNDQLGQLRRTRSGTASRRSTRGIRARCAADQKETDARSRSRARQASTDAFFDMAKLTADGKLDIDVFFGWDYHYNFHLKHSQGLLHLAREPGLQGAGRGLGRTSTRTPRAFTKKMTANGKTITVEVRMYFGKPGTVTDPDTDAGGKVLEDIARESLTKRDVVVYSGHSGPFYGFALANWNKTLEGDLDDSEMRTIPLAVEVSGRPRRGCDTYQIGEAFLENPDKAGKNIDVITTTSFSNAATPGDGRGLHRPRCSRDDSLGRLRPQTDLVAAHEARFNAYEAGFHTMYGMHGIDNNPKLLPFANTAASARPARRTRTAAGRAICASRWARWARAARRHAPTTEAAATGYRASRSRAAPRARSTVRPARSN